MPNPGGGIKEENVKLCNCGRCKVELLGISMRGRRMPHAYRYHGYVYGIVYHDRRLNHARPYCRDCFPIEAHQGFRSLIYNSYEHN